MKLIDKYLLREYLVAIFCCLAGFIALFLVYDLFGRLPRFLEARTSLWVVFRYYFCVTGTMLDYITPASLLLATLYTLWRMTRHNELAAMRASGVSLYRVMLPFLAVGLAASLLSIAMKETVAPRASQWAFDLAENGFRPPPLEPLRDRAYYNSAGRRQWLIGEIDPRTPNVLHDMKLTVERKNGSRINEMETGKAEWLDGQWWFHNVLIQEYDAEDNPVGGPVTGKCTVTEMALLDERPSDFINQARKWEFLSSPSKWRYLKSHPDMSEKAKAARRFDIHRQLAMPWACLVVTLFGIPAGSRGSRQSALAGVFVAMGLFIGFYAISQVGVFLSKTGLLAPWLGAWLPNFFFSVAGTKMIANMR